MNTVCKGNSSNTSKYTNDESDIVNNVEEYKKFIYPNIRYRRNSMEMPYLFCKGVQYLEGGQTNLTKMNYPCGNSSQLCSCNRTNVIEQGNNPVNTIPRNFCNFINPQQSISPNSFSSEQSCDNLYFPSADPKCVDARKQGPIYGDSNFLKQNNICRIIKDRCQNVPIFIQNPNFPHNILPELNHVRSHKNCTKPETNAFNCSKNISTKEKKKPVLKNLKPFQKGIKELNSKKKSLIKSMPCEKNSKYVRSTSPSESIVSIKSNTIPCFSIKNTNESAEMISKADYEQIYAKHLPTDQNIKLPLKKRIVWYEQQEHCDNLSNSENNIWTKNNSGNDNVKKTQSTLDDLKQISNDILETIPIIADKSNDFQSKDAYGSRYNIVNNIPKIFLPMERFSDSDEDSENVDNDQLHWTWNDEKKIENISASNII